MILLGINIGLVFKMLDLGLRSDLFLFEFFFDVFSIGFMVVKVVFKFGLFKLMVLLFFLIFGNDILVVLLLLFGFEFFFVRFDWVLLRSIWGFVMGEFDFVDDNVFLVLFIIGFGIIFCFF